MRELGRGGSGVVYEAESVALGKRVALKLLHAGALPDQESRDRFLAEARSAARVSHPNVVDIQDLGVTDDGAPYLVMERLEGETLADLQSRGKLAPVLACELVQQVLAGLAAAHRKGLIHCDLKPANVLVTYPLPDTPLVKILDFGANRWALSREEGAGVTWGTPMYMAPEQVQGEALDERADVYAACAILYVLLTGAEPYTGKTARKVMEQVARGELRSALELNPTLPAGLVELLDRGMRRRREERVGSVEELAEQLRKQLDGLRPAPLSVGSQRLAQVGPSRTRARAEASRPPESSVVRIEVSPRMVTDSLLMSPRLPKAPAAAKMQAGRDFMPMHGDPERNREIEQRARPTRQPRAAAIAPAVAAMLVGFSVGVVIAWLAGLI